MSSVLLPLFKDSFYHGLKHVHSMHFLSQAQHIINEHTEHRREEREQEPQRFCRKPTLGELAVRRAPSSYPADRDYYSEEPTVEKEDTKPQGSLSLHLSDIL